MVPDRAHHPLFLGGLEDVVIFIVMGNRPEIAKSRCGDFIVGSLEQKKFQFRRHDRSESLRLSPCHLTLQHLARRMGDRFMRMVIQDVTDRQSRSIKPRDRPQSRKIGLHDIVAVAALPRRRRIAVGSCHGEIRGKQVIAAMGLALSHIQKRLCMEALAHQPALHVDHAGQNGIDAACGRSGLELFERHRAPSCLRMRGTAVRPRISRIIRSGMAARRSACPNCTGGKSRRLWP